jgi:hypothetical protein
MDRAVSAAARLGSANGLDAGDIATGDDRPYEQGVDRLVHRVLQSAREQRQTRNATNGVDVPSTVHPTANGSVGGREGAVNVVEQPRFRVAAR